MDERERESGAGGAPAPGRNVLGGEKSPYLLQHRDNPVWWRPWGPEAFEAARREDKPVFLSVGYSTCHWCHVMAHESFEDGGIAGLLNEHFIAVKVDREERPDVDDIYMSAVQAMVGQGGWPMSVWLTPDGRPFFGGTYFPRHAFADVLARLAAAWRGDRERIEQVGSDLAAALSAHDAAERGGAITDETLSGYLRSFEAVFDPDQGGRRGAPKFPPAYDLRLLLRIHRRSGESAALEMVRATLDRMAAGGIYDHLGGGFHRYATDERWLVPHFEKMLYDQASLTSAYTEAWQVTGADEYAHVARETVDYVLRELTHPDGAFLSAEDADSEGEEGKFYVWTEAEMRELLTTGQLDAVSAAYGVTARGNFEGGTNILHLQPGHVRSDRPTELGAARSILFEAREKRIRPHRDDKVLTSWNGLMISALARAGRVFGKTEWVEAARRAARFILENLRGGDGRLLRRWRDGEARFPAYVDDYAFFIDGLIEIHQADFDAAWIREARGLQEIQDELFGGPDGGGYFFTDGADATLLKRGRVFVDNVRPAGNSVSALNLLRLSALQSERTYADRARDLLASASGTAAKFPMAFPFLFMAAEYSLDRSKEIAITGPVEAAREMIEAVCGVGAAGPAFRPNQVVAVSSGREQDDLPLSSGRGSEDGTVTAHVCESGACQRPVTDPGDAALLADAKRPWGSSGA